MLVLISKSARVKVIVTRNGEYISDMKTLSEKELDFLSKFSSRNHTNLTLMIDKKNISHAVIIDLADFS